jgi:hypothetical protein
MLLLEVVQTKQIGDPIRLAVWIEGLNGTADFSIDPIFLKRWSPRAF